MHNNHYTVLEEAVAGPKSRKKETVQESMPDTRRGGFGGFGGVSQRSFFAQAGWLESAAATCSAEDGRWLWRRITADPRAGCARC